MSHCDFAFPIHIMSTYAKESLTIYEQLDITYLLIIKIKT